MLLVSLSVTSCGGDGVSGVRPHGPTEIFLSPLQVGFDALRDRKHVDAVILNENGERVFPPGLVWASENEAVATVDGAGNVTSVSNGETFISLAVDSVSARARVRVEQVPRELIKRSNDAQVDTVGHVLPESLAVEAADRLGSPVPGTVVYFAVTTGGGSVRDDSVIATETAHAWTVWTLGTVSGSGHTVTASLVPGGVSPAQFTAFALPDRPDSLQLVSGDGQGGPAGRVLGDSLVVVVLDRFGNGVPGVAVEFSVLAGGGAVTPQADTTGTLGRAAVTWLLGAVGAQAAEARVPGLRGSPVTFSATAN